MALACILPLAEFRTSPCVYIPCNLSWPKYGHIPSLTVSCNPRLRVFPCLVVKCISRAPPSTHIQEIGSTRLKYEFPPFAKTQEGWVQVGAQATRRFSVVRCGEFHHCQPVDLKRYWIVNGAPIALSIWDPRKVELRMGLTRTAHSWRTNRSLQVICGVNTTSLLLLLKRCPKHTTEDYQSEPGRVTGKRQRDADHARKFMDIVVESE